MISKILFINSSKSFYSSSKEIITCVDKYEIKYTIQVLTKRK